MRHEKLADLCIRISNGTSAKQNKDNIGLNVTRIETISMGEINPDKVGHIDVPIEDVKIYVLQEGDILFSHINSVEHIGKTAIYTGHPKNLIHGMNLLRFEIKKEKVSSNYLLYFLRYPPTRQYYRNRCKKAVNQASLVQKDILSLEVPLPSLEVQEKIVRVLDAVSEVIRLRKKLIENLNQLPQTLFIQMFGNIVKNEKKWETQTAEELFEMKLGKMLSAKNYTGKNLKFYLRNINVKWGYLDLSDVKQMDFNENEFTRYELKKGDILVCEGGEVGRTAVFNGEIENCCYQNALHRLRIIKPVITREYFIYYMWFAAKYGLILKDTSQVTIAHFTSENFKKFKILVPPIKLQNEFVELFKKIKLTKEKELECLRKDEELFSSLMQQAFSGELK